MTVPYAFGAATSAIPLSQLDSNFNTPITLGNTAIQLGNTVTTLNNMTLANVTISSGNVTITNVSVTTVNASTVNTTTLVATTANVTTINATDVNVAANVTLNAGTVNGVAYLNGSKVLTTGSALTFDGTNFGIGTSSPNAKLVVAGGSQYITNTAGNAAGIEIAGNANTPTTTSLFIGQGSTSLGFIYQRANADLAFGINNTEQMRLTSTGLGIGTSTPQGLLDVRKDQVAATRIIANNQNASNGASTNFDYYYGTTRLGGLVHGFNVSGAYLNIDVWNGSAATTRATFDSSGNLGLGVTPSAWVSYKALQVAGTGGGIASSSSSDLELVTNAYYSGGWLSQGAGVASSRYRLQSGAHAWYNAPSGSAGNAITFTQAMTLDASGDVVIGDTTTNAIRLSIAKNNPTRGILAHVYNLGSSGQTGAQIQFTQNGIANWAIGQPAGTDAFAFWSGRNTASDGTERARITSGGSFQLGSSTGNDPRLFVYDNDSTDAAIVVRQDGAAPIQIWQGSSATERARITSGGDLLVGTTDAGATTGVGVKTVVSATIPAVFTVFNTAGGGNAYNFYNTNATNNGYRFYVKVDGGIANYQANDLNLSDVRKKTDIQPAGSYLDKICSIPVKTFLYKDQSDTARNLGVIAQDVDAVAPELVDRDGFGETPEGESPYLSIYQTDLQYALMKALQELKAEFDAYKATHP